MGLKKGKAARRFPPPWSIEEIGRLLFGQTC
jgi:hypothetical protein